MTFLAGFFLLLSGMDHSDTWVILAGVALIFAGA